MIWGSNSLFQKFQLTNVNNIRVKLIYTFMGMAMADDIWTHWAILAFVNREQSSLISVLELGFDNN